MFKRKLDLIRSMAREEAIIELKNQNFSQGDQDCWSGEIDINGEKIELSVRLLQDFPDCLPEICIRREDLPFRIPHVEKSGKLCLVPNTGVLIDSSKPRKIITEAIAKARDRLFKGLSGVDREDFFDEFLAYWHDNAVRSKSICSLILPSREVCLAYYPSGRMSSSEKSLIADSLLDAERWLDKLGLPITRHESAWLFKITEPFLPPDFNQALRTKDVIKIIKQACSPSEYRCFENRIKDGKLPCIILFTIPIESEEEGFIVGVRFEKAFGGRKKGYPWGFGVNRVPPLLEFKRTYSQPVTKLYIDRLDSAYLLPRGGASMEISNRTAVIIGCGAIGSRLAEYLATLGVGTLRLIDHEKLISGNVHRHVLGVDSIDKEKVSELQTVLERRYPHINFDARNEKVLEVLEKEADFIIGVDIIIVALGDETLELRINDLIGDEVHRIHVWLEPLGIGGHVLATGISKGIGCYRCLFREKSGLGLANHSAFAEAGQNFQKTLSGCIGSFTPFSGIDAARAAIEGARITADILTGKEQENVLVSWFEDPTAFINAGFKLTPRSKIFKVGERKKTKEFYERSCTCNK